MSSCFCNNDYKTRRQNLNLRCDFLYVTFRSIINLASHFKVPGYLKGADWMCSLLHTGILELEHANCSSERVVLLGYPCLVILPGDIHLLTDLLQWNVFLPWSEGVQVFESCRGDDCIVCHAAYGLVSIYVSVIVHLLELQPCTCFSTLRDLGGVVGHILYLQG